MCGIVRIVESQQKKEGGMPTHDSLGPIAVVDVVDGGNNNYYYLFFLLKMILIIVII